MSPVHACTVTLRWKDFDALGHLNHACVVTAFEEGRDDFLKATLGIPSPMYVIRRMEIDYVAEVPLSERLVTVQCSTVQVGRTSLVTLERLVRSDGVVAAESRTTTVWWDADAHASRPFTDDEKALLLAASS